MTTHSLSSLRRTVREIGAMLLMAAVALCCVAGVSQKIEKRLQTSVARVSETTFADNSLPIPEGPSPPAMVMITSPIDGVFQAGNTSGGPALVEVGTKVTPETKLGTVEPEDATPMPILAGVTGTVKAILVSDQELVMTGQALIEIEPTQMPETPKD